jgi:hypothetical protein
VELDDIVDVLSQSCEDCGNSVGNIEVSWILHTFYIILDADLLGILALFFGKVRGDGYKFYKNYTTLEGIRWRLIRFFRLLLNKMS